MHPTAEGITACRKSARLRAPASSRGQSSCRRGCCGKLLMGGSSQGATWAEQNWNTWRMFLLSPPPGYFLQLKSRVLMTPLAVSPPRSTPEPDVSSIPQDAATIPNSAAPQALTGMQAHRHHGKRVSRSHGLSASCCVFQNEQSSRKLDFSRLD